MKPDPRRTEDAVERVRAVFAGAEMVRSKDGSFWIYEFSSRHTLDDGRFGYGKALGHGETPKDAWWAAVPIALAKALLS